MLLSTFCHLINRLRNLRDVISRNKTDFIELYIESLMMKVKKFIFDV